MSDRPGALTEPTPAPSVALGADVAADRLRIVVAEDEAIIRLDVVEMLQEEGCEVVAETGRGDEVVALVRAHEPDLVILDIKMPGLDGLSVARALDRELGAAVVVLTAFSQREMVAEAVDAGVLAYLVKPFQKAELVAALTVAAGRHRERAALRGQVADLESRLAARRLVERAKGRLMDRDGCSEAEAYATLQRRAMDARTTMRAVAEAVLAEA